MKCLNLNSYKSEVDFEINKLQSIIKFNSDIFELEKKEKKKFIII